MHILAEVKQHVEAYKEELQKSLLLVLGSQNHSSNPLAAASNMNLFISTSHAYTIYTTLIFFGFRFFSIFFFNYRR